jgi:hypothetical protein
LTVRRILSAAVILGIFFGTQGAAFAKGVSYSAGVGYDYFSQRYFLDSTTGTTPDTFLARFAYTSNYLNDFKGTLGISYRSPDSRTLELRGGYEQTAHLLRTKFSGTWRPKLGPGKIDWHSEADWRHQFSGSASSGTSYLLGSTVLRYKLPVGASTTLWGSGQADGVHFADSAAYAYDYVRGGGKIGVEQAFGDFNLIQADVFILGRSVPDSGSLSYFSGGLESSLFGTFGRADLDLLARFEVKNYFRADALDDYSRLDLDGRCRFRLGDRLFARSDFSGDFTWYKPADQLNPSSQRVAVAALAGPEWGGWSIGLGPEAEFLHQRPSDATDREDYFELGGRVSFDLVAPGKAVASVESTTGRRTIKYPSSFLTSFNFERLSLFADWTIFGGLSLNTLGTAEWEWHTDSANNNALFLISSNLVFRF